MAAPEEDALDVGLRLARALEAARLPYALGGALAYGRYGVPRATVDGDVNIFVGAERYDDVLSTLTHAGVGFDADAAKREAGERGMMVGHSGGTRVDVYVPSIESAWEALRTRRELAVGNERVWFRPRRRSPYSSCCSSAARISCFWQSTARSWTRSTSARSSSG
jgi:hypothetical protein